MPWGVKLSSFSRVSGVGENTWMQPSGDGNRVRNHPMLRNLDLPPLGGDGRGGPLVTKTLLVGALTAGGTDDGPRLVARDTSTRLIVGSVDLPSGAIGTPMTYMVDGPQHIAFTVGGGPSSFAFRRPNAKEASTCWPLSKWCGRGDLNPHEPLAR